MYRGDRSRKQTLVDFGFRLPSALDNRPLQFEEFDQKAKQAVFVSATPSEYEFKVSGENIFQQIIRPTGLIDPVVEVKKATNQVEDFLFEARKVIDRGDRVLVTTLTKRMAEDLSEYYRELGLRVRYLHSDVDTLDRIELIRGLRTGVFDLLVGINLLREGLDLPEVSLVGIMDADKEGFLRSRTSLIQTIGRAARNTEGRVILYADRLTDSIQAALKETDRRREIQQKHNQDNGITPVSVKRAIGARMVENEIEVPDFLLETELPRDFGSCTIMIAKLKKEMFDFAKKYEFEKAAEIRDRIKKLEEYLIRL